MYLLYLQEAVQVHHAIKQTYHYGHTDVKFGLGACQVASVQLYMQVSCKVETLHGMYSSELYMQRSQLDIELDIELDICYIAAVSLDNSKQS